MNLEKGGGKLVSRRKHELRQRISQLKVGNILASEPLGEPTSYDLVASFFCAEAVTDSKEGWKQNVANLSSLVAPGGTLVMAAVQACDHYDVFDVRYPVAQVQPDDFRELLPSLGFDPATLDVRSAPVDHFTEQGFSAIFMAYAVKREDKFSNAQIHEQKVSTGGGMRDLLLASTFSNTTRQAEWLLTRAR